MGTTVLCLQIYCYVFYFGNRELGSARWASSEARSTLDDIMDDRSVLTLIAGMVGVYLVSAALTFVQTWMTGSSWWEKYRLHKPVANRLPKLDRFKRPYLIMLFVACLWTVYLTQTYDWIISEESVGIVVSLGQLLVILLVYDFMFYWVHRVFHHPFLMRHLHHVHHRVGTRPPWATTICSRSMRYGLRRCFS